MTINNDSKSVFTDETERKPNLYASNVLTAVSVVLLIVWILDQINIFTVNKLLMSVCLVISVVLFFITQAIVHNKNAVINPVSKYFIISMVLFLVLCITVILNINAVLAYALPLLLAAQYRSRTISLMALIGSCVISVISPILSFFLSTWSTLFLTGYIQIFCRVTISMTPGNEFDTLQSITQILLYWAMPQMLTILAFGIILFSSTKNNIKSVHNQMRVIDLSNDLSRELESITTMQERLLCSMSDIIEKRDLETGGHVRRTSEVIKLLMNAVKADRDSGISDDFCYRVINTAPMHDLGKIAIPDTILRKNDSLTPEEFEIIKQHPLKSAEIISRALTDIEDEKLLKTALNIAKYHHECFDGSGYPEGLSGKSIPLEARIMSLADVYDALVSRRYYKDPMPFDEAFDAIEKLMGKKFDPDLNPYFLACRDKIEEFYRNENTELFE